MDDHIRRSELLGYGSSGSHDGIPISKIHGATANAARAPTELLGNLVKPGLISSQ